ncbi:MAG: hypothetical protein WC619_03700 [Patescibacteria group bacterium]
MREFLSKIKKSKTAIFCIATFCIFSFLIGNFSFAETNPAAAAGGAVLDGVGLAVATLLSWIAWAFTIVFGLLLTLLVQILVNVAQFSNIINVAAVEKGWIIVRDLCNMSFILILLIIAFATILRQENYSAKKILPKLLLMAVLINFSKTIFGLLIDFSQVVMLTFVNGFAQNGPGNFIAMFQTDKIMTMWGGKGDVSSWSIVVAIITGVIALIITNIVVLVMLAILVMRIIMLWVYTILSPLVFLGFAFPPVQNYTKEIWEDFNKQLVVGPVLAFFLWLALATASDSSNKLGSGAMISGAGGTAVGGEQVCAGISKLFCEGEFQTFIITIGLLMGGLMVAQKAGGAAGSIAGKGMSLAQSTLKAGGIMAASPLLGAKALAGFTVDKIHQGTGVDLNLPRAWKVLQERRADIKKQRYALGQQKAGQVMAGGNSLHGALAMTGSPGDAWDQITTLKGIRQRIMGGKYMEGKRGEYQTKIEAPGKELKTLEEERAGVLSSAEFEGQKTSREVKIEEAENQIISKTAEAKTAQDAGDFTKARTLNNEIDGLKKEQEEKRAEIADLGGKVVSDDKITSLNSQIAKKTGEVEAAKKEYQPKIDKNIPMYNFEAKGAEAKAVGEEASKIKDIDDASELVRMLEGAIAAKEKSRIKAISRKLTADANDNEIFEKLTPTAGSGYEGMQQFIRAISGTLNEKDLAANPSLKNLNAGFDPQEAMSLGAQMAEMNKKTNHWEATAAYEMKDGQWEETDAESHAKIASTEFGKNGPRANAKNFNRLAMGKHIVDPATGEKSYELADVGLIALQSWDNPTSIDRMLEDMTESNAKFLVPFLKKLEDEKFFKTRGPKEMILSDGSKGYPNLADMIRLKANEAKVDFSEQFENVTRVREKVNKKV